MTALTFKVSKQKSVLGNSKKILVVGPFYEKTRKLLHVENMIENYDLTIFNGGLCEPFNDLQLIRNHIDILDRMFETKKVVYNLGNKDMMFQQGLLLLDSCPPDIDKWLKERPNVVMVTFPNNNQLVVTNGGLTDKMNLDTLVDNIETTFIRAPWHQQYNGRMGYVISNEPLSLEAPQFHNFSAQIGNIANRLETQVYAQEVDQFGCKSTILL